MVSTFFALCSDKRQQSLTAYVPMPKGMGLTPHLITKQKKGGIPKGVPLLFCVSHMIHISWSINHWRISA